MRGARWRSESPDLVTVTFGKPSSGARWRPDQLERDRTDRPGPEVMAAGPHWGAWGRAAVRLMEARNADLVAEYGLGGVGCHFSLEESRLVFRCQHHDLVTDLCVLGSLDPAQERFTWAWADGAIPARARQDLERVREFGELNALDALVTSEWPAGRTGAFELAAAAARVLYARGLWIAPAGDTLLYFALSNPRRAPRLAAH
jgi:hypothetical protein